MNPNPSAANSYDWYSHPVYQRFWSHYSSVMSWCQSQRQLHVGAIAGPIYPSFHRRFPAPPGLRLMTDSPRTSPPSLHPPKPLRPPRTPHIRICLKRPRVVTPESQQSFVESEKVEELEMEISEDLKTFLEKSEKHRQEREARKAAKLKDEKSDKRVDATATVHELKANVTEEAPKERPGVRRTFEMKLLYGVDAAKIHGMETAMQLTFDRNCDRFQPKLWPIMPFNIKFS